MQDITTEEGLGYLNEECRRAGAWSEAVEAVAENDEARREWLWLHSGARGDLRAMRRLEHEDPGLRSRLAWALDALAEHETPRARRRAYLQLSEECFARHARRLLTTPCECAECAELAAG